jgi:hypothetical protein
MPAINRDLHGNAPDTSHVALLLIDVINDLEFPEGDQLLRHALPMAGRIAELKARPGGDDPDRLRQQLPRTAMRQRIEVPSKVMR